MNKVKMVAEIGSNWEPGNLDSALEMIRVAADCGADAVKFQWFIVDSMDRPDWWKEKSRPWNLSKLWLPKLSRQAENEGLGFCCSLWHLSRVYVADYVYLEDYGGVKPCCIKVAASELSNQRLLRNINRGAGGLPVYLSIDYRKQGALIPALIWLSDCDVTLLHTVSDYPAESSKLEYLEKLKSFGLSIGYSNHCPYPLAVSACADAVSLGAEVVEAHLRMETTPESCPDNGPWALFPEHFEEMVEVIRGA